MGYTTDFSGQFSVDPPLDQSQIDYLTQFATTRHMARYEALTEFLPDPARLSVGLPVGFEGSYYVGAEENDGSVIDYNHAPGEERNRFSNTNPIIPANHLGQPGLWCQWVPTDDGAFIEWDGGEKFYDSTEWIRYIVDHFLSPWGRTLSGAVDWQGEDSDDRGTIYAVDGVIHAVNDVITKPGPPTN